MSTRQQTNVGVLPQPRPLESMPADNLRVRTKRGMDAATAKVGAAPGAQHGRGETGSNAGVTPQGAACKGNPRQGTDQRVFVLDRRKKPLMPTTARRARKLLTSGRAVVHKVYPFTIRIKDRRVEESVVEGVILGIDPGSQHTGLAVAVHTETADSFTGEVVAVRSGLWLGQLDHRGRRITMNLTSRSQLRRGRRSRNLRYRAPRFTNRTKPEGWLAPSLQHRVDTTMSWVARLSKVAPVAAVSVELAKFDTQKMATPNIAGVQYQQGTLAELEVREYLLEKYARACVYCDRQGVVLNLDHVHPKSKGGSNRVGNLVLSCVDCNDTKGNHPVEVFLAGDPKRLSRIKASLSKPLPDAAAVNATRWALVRRLKVTGLPVEVATGSRTKWNRTRSGVPKTHALDALCVGTVDTVRSWPGQTLHITCTGRGAYQRAMTDRYGFPKTHRSRQKIHFGYATGDMVRADIPRGKHIGVHAGRVGVRARGTFLITTPSGPVESHHLHLTLISRNDGYAYTIQGSTHETS